MGGTIKLNVVFRDQEGVELGTPITIDGKRHIETKLRGLIPEGTEKIDITLVNGNVVTLIHGGRARIIKALGKVGLGMAKDFRADTKRDDKKIRYIFQPQKNSIVRVP